MSDVNIVFPMAADFAARINIIDSMFTSATVSSVITLLSSVNIGSANQIGSIFLCISAACKGVVKNVDAVERAVAALPACFKIGTRVNMTAMALLGHVMYMMPLDWFTPRAAADLQVYRASIGGLPNLWAFGTFGTVPNRPKRTDVLRQYASKAAPTNAELEIMRTYAMVADPTNSFFTPAPAIIGVPIDDHDDDGDDDDTGGDADTGSGTD